ncbi:UDP-4-amino-4,6-dideoxy-N-acetyl-beta-L-altrosamine transaminase [Woodsholea maritima]|uniref:UDP-4-amino-4, 6-dideoxy-N-acetyl-beta-L-altrosamine transaminase n=1 Tax=Woodsholea maritima TaxID=240237 RepID=UPI00037D47A3|nr:UDP-4-amino-4,6-dideoxy-N-acetyl-beta-L-altrosamine transaminase [Woodsholea maritima]
MSLPFLPYGRQDIDEHDIAAVLPVLSADYLTTGPEVSGFEADFKTYVGAAHAISCNSATAALHLALAGLGVGPGDICIVPTITFLATANAVRYCGAEVQFCDVDPRTGLMTPETLEAALAAAQGPVKAILPVHLGGAICDMPAIAALAHHHGAFIVEDACHAIGGVHHEGAKVGECKFSDAATFSFHPVKTLTSGEGGMVTTQNPVLARWIEKARSHGMERDPAHFTQAGHGDEGWYYEMVELGWNYRMPDILAALGRSQLKKMPEIVARRAQLSNCYSVRLAALDERLEAPPVLDQQTPCRHLMNVQIDFEGFNTHRVAVMAALRDLGIGSQVHYIPVHTQPYYEARYGRTLLPGALAYYTKTLSLPLYARLKLQDVDRVVDGLCQILGVAT